MWANASIFVTFPLRGGAGPAVDVGIVWTQTICVKAPSRGRPGVRQVPQDPRGRMPSVADASPVGTSMILKDLCRVADKHPSGSWERPGEGAVSDASVRI